MEGYVSLPLSLYLHHACFFSSGFRKKHTTFFTHLQKVLLSYCFKKTIISLFISNNLKPHFGFYSLAGRKLAIFRGELGKK
ncbi:MAG: hypothetical protein IJ669_06445, partial [Prevotella sp.]|nr:hypothetical protein [Prevotella sp.]